MQATNFETLLTAIEFECPDSGYRHWVVTRPGDTDAVIEDHIEMGYELSDIDSATTATRHEITEPRPRETMGGTENPTSGNGWAFTYDPGR